MYTCSPRTKVCRCVDGPVLVMMLVGKLVALWMMVGETLPDVTGDVVHDGG